MPEDLEARVERIEAELGIEQPEPLLHAHADEGTKMFHIDSDLRIMWTSDSGYRLTVKGNYAGGAGSSDTWHCDDVSVGGTLNA